MDLIIATNNKGKLKEFREILKDKFDNIYGLAEKNIDIEIEETGETFQENALIKAKTIAEIADMPALGDDSGLCVEALGGAPGIFSARYAGEECDWKQNNLKIVKDMQGVENRNAYFISSLVLYYPDGKTVTAEGRTYGKLLESPRGENGFGYDPLFLSDELGVTFAEADADVKNKVSHRAKAINALLKQL
ncbi:MAG: RdgB/HAM1 family non-canonical purine NTP pyrophosphatase [Christensenellales bacterium]